MALFWSTFLLIFLSEIADKSRVVGLLLTTTYRAPWSLFWGMTLGYVLLDGIAVLIGGTLSLHIPPLWIKSSSSILFMGLGLATFFAGEQVAEQGKKWLAGFNNRNPFVVSFVAIGVSEIADRTQLAAAALSAESGRPLIVFSGTITALALLNFLTIWLGEKIARRISSRMIHRVSGLGFFLVGLILLIQIFR